MAMTWVEDMRDRASRVIPTPFAEVVEEATSDVLLTPDWDRNFNICEFANSKPENITDIVRAIRRRIDHKSSKVQYFTVILLQTLIKSCGLPVHREIAETKGLLRDLVTIAQKDCGADGDREAKEAALQLILSMSYWFDNHPSADVVTLAQLANYARTKGVSFEGVEREEFTVLIDVPMPTNAPRAGRRVPHSQAARQRPSSGSQAQQQRTSQRTFTSEVDPSVYGGGNAGGGRGGAFGDARIVDAIPLEPPSEAQIQAYMDNVMLLVECINTAEQEHASLTANDFIASVASQVRQEHAALSLIVSSGIELANMDVLLSVSDSQLSVVERLKAATTAGGAGQQRAPVGATVAPGTTPPRPAAAVIPTLTVDSQQHQPQQRLGDDAPVQPSAAPPLATQQRQQPVAPRQPAPVAQPTAAAAVPPTLQLAPASRAPAESASSAASNYAPPSIDDLFAQVTQVPPATRSAPADATTVPTATPPAPAPEAAQPALPVGPLRPMAFPQPSQSVNPAEPVAVGMAHTDGPTAPAGSINDDFDAFLDSRLSGHR